MLPSDPPPRSSQWLSPSFLLSIVLVLVSSGALWGVMTARQDAADRDRAELRAQLQATNAQLGAVQVRQAAMESDAAGTRRLIDTELAGLRREMERIAKAVERLSDSRISRRGE